MNRGLPILGSVLATLVLFGCGEGRRPMKVSWDLSHSHTMADVHWPEPDLSSIELTPFESVRIRLPGERIFVGGQEIGDIGLDREGAKVVDVLVYSEPQTLRDAYQLALGWAERWDLPRRSIDDWHRERQRSRDRTYTAISVAPRGRTTGPGGPEPSLKLLDSFDDHRPVVVSLRFTWTQL